MQICIEHQLLFKPTLLKKKTWATEVNKIDGKGEGKSSKYGILEVR